MADMDVVLFLNDFEHMDAYLAKLPDVLQELKTIIQSNTDSEFYIKDGQPGHHALKIKLGSRTNTNARFFDVDVLPACNNLARCTPSEIYDEMAKRTTSEREYYSSSLSPLQVKFVRDKIKDSANVKNLTRVVKYWSKTHLQTTDESRKICPTSYVFELLVINRWEQAGQPVSFSMEKGFKDVLTHLVNYRDINACWSTNYNTNDIQGAVVRRPNTPYILDPANPFNNVCAKFDAWDEVAQIAGLSLQCPLLHNVDVSPNWA